MAFLTDEEVRILQMKVHAAERMTSAEFKIIIAQSAWLGVNRLAARLFRKYRLHETAERNAVLLLVLEKDRQVRIHGDEAINAKVPDDFWRGVRDEMLGEFRHGRHADGLTLGLHLVVDALKEHFPADPDAIDEVSNDIVFER